MSKWHSEQYGQQWLRGLEIHVFPKIGNLAVGSVDLAAVRSVIEPIWYDKPRVAQLVRANIESVLNMAYAEGQRSADNPARWALVRHSLPARKGARTAGHLRALPYADMPVLLSDLKPLDEISALCLRFTILTVARTKESTSSSATLDVSDSLLPSGSSTIPPAMVCRSEESRTTKRSPTKAKIGEARFK